MTEHERKILMKLKKYGIHYDKKRLREFIKMVDDTCEQVKEIEKKKQRERARKVLSVINKNRSSVCSHYIWTNTNDLEPPTPPS